MFHQQYQRRQVYPSPAKGAISERREGVNRLAKVGEEDDEHSKVKTRQPNRHIKSLEEDEVKIEGAVEVELSEEEVELSEDEVEAEIEYQNMGEEQR